MENQAFTTIFFLLIGGAIATTLTVTNNCNEAIWISTNSSPGKPRLQPSDAAFMLPPKGSRSMAPPEAWSGHLWAATKCTVDRNSRHLLCASGGCGPEGVSCAGALPTSSATMVDFVLASSGGGSDRYMVHLLTGFNVPIAVVPGDRACSNASCPANLISMCPSELRVLDHPGGKTVACTAPCRALKDPENCCFEPGPGGRPTKCKPTKYTDFFKKACPLAFVYPNDVSGNFGCAAGTNYAIKFCPFF